MSRVGLLYVTGAFMASGGVILSGYVYSCHVEQAPLGLLSLVLVSGGNMLFGWALGRCSS